MHFIYQTKPQLEAYVGENQNSSSTEKFFKGQENRKKNSWRFVNIYVNIVDILMNLAKT